MRLAAIERPGLLIRIGWWLSRRQLGKVITPLQVIYPRVPRFVRPHLGLVRYAQSGTTLPSRLRHLVEAHVSDLNGCTFCSDLHRALALGEGLSAELLASPATSPDLTEPERAALAYAGEVVRTKKPTDATFERVRAAFTEQQVVELTFLVAFTTYLNLLALPLGIGSDGLCALRAERESAGKR